MVDDVITPLFLTPDLDAIGARDIDQLTWGSVKYGNFFAAVIKFVVIAFVLFLLIKEMARIIKKKEEAPAATPEDMMVLREIRDSLKN